MTLRPNDYDRNGDIIPDSVRLIDADKLKEELNRIIGEHAYSNAVNAIIDNAPTVEAFTKEYVSGAYNEGYMCGNKEAEKERPQGERIETQRGIHVTDYKCSCCGRTVRDDTGYDVASDYPFCHCGADMRGGNK